ncbi:hypothetical protein KUV50_06505 [Membranicola marinus]|uniref:Uncharacterized protein n=1 Tax=Membranihabitans marinus TaxID=1227546 RepID=A0A953HLB9_9BACT|nr:hypothetical protein [Membranihabitans marinus]MBY5957772.1 hypothetical protein [Membranihabitans marinus]
MKGLAYILLPLLSLTSGWSQTTGDSIWYTLPFTTLMENTGIEVRTDSLDHYLLTDHSNPYLGKTDLYLVNEQDEKEFIVLIDEESIFPQIKFSSHVANLMNNENDHSIAFYSLDEYFILTELRADWAADAQFLIKDQEAINGYARSFYNAETNVQVTVILLAQELPLLKTPVELTALRFK